MMNTWDLNKKYNKWLDLLKKIDFYLMSHLGLRPKEQLPLNIFVRVVIR